MSTKLSNFFTGIGCLSMLIGCILFIYFLINKSVGTAFLYAFGFFVLMIILVMIGSQIEENKKKKQKNYLSALQPTEKIFQETQSFTSFDLLSRITTDEQNERIYLWAPENQDVQSLKDISYGMPYQLFSYDYTEILAVEVVENGAPHSIISRRSQSARFFLDGLQPISEDSSKEQADGQLTYSILLKLIMKDNVKPIHLIHFYIDSAKNPNKNSVDYQNALKSLDHWFTVLHFIMKDIDKTEGYEYDDNEENTDLIKTSSSNIEKEAAMQKLGAVDFKNNEKIALARAQLISVLNQVTYIKLNQDTLLNNDEKTNRNSVISTSYFNQLLKKNKEQMRGDVNKE